MGLFDKIKASVGIGGAKIELFAPRIVVGGTDVAVRAAVRGGKLAQQLNAVQLSLEVWPDNREAEEGKPAPGPTISYSGVFSGSEKQDIKPGAELLFETKVPVPFCQELYMAAPEMYASLVLPSDDDDINAWNADGPLPFMSGWESRTLYLLASADIPGAIDPSDKSQIHVLPEAGATLVPAPGLDEAELQARLARAGATRVFVSNASDTWFIWWSRGDGRVVGYSPIQVVCSVRAEGIVRAIGNPAIPTPSIFPAQADEPSFPVAGDDAGLEEARVIARALVAQSESTLLPRPIGNAWAALSGLTLAE